MGIGTSGTESATRYTTGNITATGSTAGMYCHQNFNVSLWGTFVGTVIMDRSFDAGTTWLPLSFSDGTAIQFTAPMSSNWSEPEAGVMYRLRCSAYTSGTINWRLSQ